MGFIESIENDAAAILGEQKTSHTVLYLALGVAPGAAVDAIWDPLDQISVTFEDVRYELFRGVLQTLPSAIATPDTKDAFKIDGVEYSVDLASGGLDTTQWPLVVWHLVERVPERFGGAESHVERSA